MEERKSMKWTYVSLIANGLGILAFLFIFKIEGFTDILVVFLMSTTVIQNISKLIKKGDVTNKSFL